MHGLLKNSYIKKSFFCLVSKKDVYSKGYFMHEKHKANQNLQRRKKQRRKKKGRKLIKLKENYPKLYDGSLLFKILVKKLLILVDDLNILLL